MSAGGRRAGAARTCCVRRRGRGPVRTMAAVLALLGVLAACGRGGGVPGGAARLRVAVSIGPLVRLTRAVAGGAVEVVEIVPPGADPHSFALRPSTLWSLGRSRLLVLNGLGLEFWAPDALEALGPAAPAVVKAGEGLELIDANPHVWLDVRRAAAQAGRIAAALVRVDPARAAVYRRNAAALRTRLRRLDAEVAAEVGRWRRRAFVADHPVWSYFAARYGLAEVGVLTAAAGHEPSLHRIARLVALARRRAVAAVFTEVGRPGGLAEAMARELRVSLVALDPLGARHPEEDFVALVRRNVAQMAAVFR